MGQVIKSTKLAAAPVANISRRHIIWDGHFVTFSYQFFRQVRADKSGPTNDQNRPHQ
jgi:hypothetical protein